LRDPVCVTCQAGCQAGSAYYGTNHQSTIYESLH